MINELICLREQKESRRSFIGTCFKIIVTFAINNCFINEEDYMKKNYIIIKRMSLISNIILLFAMVCLLGYYIWYLIDLNNYESGELSSGSAMAIMVVNFFSPFLIGGLIFIIVLLVIGITKANKDVSKNYNIVTAVMFFVGVMIVITANIETLIKDYEVDVIMLIMGISGLVFAIFNLIIQILRLISINSKEKVNIE